VPKGLYGCTKADDLISRLVRRALRTVLKDFFILGNLGKLELRSATVRATLMNGGWLSSEVQSQSKLS
jgi:hypothetical protein